LGLKTEKNTLFAGKNSIYLKKAAADLGGFKANLFKLPALAALAIVLALAGCDLEAKDGEDGYTFRFRVDNNTAQNITKLEFINGDRQNDDVLSTRTLSLSSGDRSSEYRVSGFTIEYGDSRRKAGVKVTFADETAAFGWYAFGHENKVLVSATYYVGKIRIDFSEGNWK
jgi:hypothetical protein